jgi:hypothetical protein
MSDVGPTENLTQWSYSARLVFRLGFCYTFLYALPLPIPGLDPLVIWVAEAILGLGPIANESTGSGDTAFAWAQAFVLFIAAVTMGLAWTTVDRNRPHYRRMLIFQTIVLRFWLGTTMLAYGAMKAVPSQFSFPSLNRLLQPYGDSSPMGLAWTFMGYSASYTMFTGFAEITGALLLFSRRTTTLGSILLIGVMTNVFMMNLSYDIPVKLNSAHLLSAALILAALDGRRLAKLFLVNAGTAPVELPRLFKSTRAHRAGLAVRALYLAALVLLFGQSSYSGYYMWGNGAEKPTYWGIWDVTGFVKGGVEVPPLRTDDSRWHIVVVDSPGYISLHTSDGQRSGLKAELDKNGAWNWTQDATTWELQVTSPSTEEMVLEGMVDGHELTVHLKRRDLDSFRLVERGFRWVSEHPYNR